MARDVDPPLIELVAGELAQPTRASVVRFAEALRDRHGDCVAAVLFYGSCLRNETNEGVLDFYVVVDSYRSAYPGLLLALANAAVPPNVFYVEHEDPEGTMRTKYAVLSRKDFSKAVSPAAWHPYIWARFCQPSRLVYCRDAEAREFSEQCAAQAIETLVRRLAVFLPSTGSVQRFSLAALWQKAFSRTYRSELRPESADTVRSVYEANSERYDEAARRALRSLVAGGWLESAEFRADSVEVRMSGLRRRLARLRWRSEWPAMKVLALVRLVKNSMTFGDWVPYILWKLQRHSGVEVELTDRQRRHPLIFAWPVLFRLLRNRVIG